MAKLGLTCNNDAPLSIFPLFTMAASAIASGDEVHLFFTPGGARALFKGRFEQMNKEKLECQPDLMEMFEAFLMLGGKIHLCEQALDCMGRKAEDFREGVEICGMTTYLNEIKDAQITFSF